MGKEQEEYYRRKNEEARRTEENGRRIERESQARKSKETSERGSYGDNNI